MSSNSVLVDSSYWVALLNPNDKHLVRAVTFSQKQTQQPILIPEVSLVEVAFLLRRNVGNRGVLQLYKFIFNHQPTMASLIVEDFKRVHKISEQYPQFDFVDCAIMTIAERLEIESICTFDRRDFSVFRPKHCDYLTLLPE